MLLAFWVALQTLLGWGAFERILGFSSSITAEEVVAVTNAERARQGLDPLIVNQTLSQAALAKGQDMLSDQYWAHVAPDGVEPWDFMQSVGYSYVVAGENLARDFADSNTMMQAWMASPTHRANIVNGRYSEIGIAVIDGELLGTQTTLVVQMFGHRAEAQIPVAEKENATQVAAVYEGLIEAEPTVELEPEVLSGVLTEVGELRHESPLFSPLQLSKAIMLLAMIAVMATLVYDFVVIGHDRTMRIVGHNIAHLSVLFLVSFLVLFFKGGFIY